MKSLERFHAECRLYSLGYWTREQPQKTGCFFCAAMTGGFTMIRIYRDPNGNYVSAAPWGGYWWSEPVPEPPEVIEQ